MGVIPSRKGSSEMQEGIKDKISGLRRTAAPSQGGDKPHPYSTYQMPIPLSQSTYLETYGPESRLCHVKKK